MSLATLTLRDLVPATTLSGRPSTNVLSDADLIWVRLRTVQSRDLQIKVSGPGRAPIWLDMVLDSLEHLLELPPDWDSYGAPSVNLSSARLALEILLSTANVAGSVSPAIVPTSRGGIQLEWSRRGIHVELDISPGAVPILFVEDEEQPQDFEAGLDPRHETLRIWLAEVARR